MSVSVSVCLCVIRGIQLTLFNNTEFAGPGTLLDHVKVLMVVRPAFASYCPLRTVVPMITTLLWRNMY